MTAIDKRGRRATFAALAAVMLFTAVVSQTIAGEPARASDQRPGTWKLTNPMDGGPRAGHTATVLTGPACVGQSPPSYCGDVLVAGGTTVQGQISAELFDTATETWAPAASMMAHRSGHTATLLPSGDVLVVDYESSTGPDGTTEGAFSAEVFDPDATEAITGRRGRWTPTGPPAFVQLTGHHTATLLPDGKVLVAGGRIEGFETSAAQLYDPDSNTWEKTGFMNMPRANHSAVLLDVSPCGQNCGKVLVVSGAYTSPHRYAAVNFTAELYDPGSKTWSLTKTPPEKSVPTLCGSINSGVPDRSCHSATLLLTGEVLVTGEPESSVVAQLFNPTEEKWRLTGSMRKERERGSLATRLPNGTVLLSGDAAVSRDAAVPSEIYDPIVGGGTWYVTGTPHANRFSHTLTLLPNGKALVAGGQDLDLQGEPKLSSAEVFDPSATTVTPLITTLDPDRGPTTGGTQVVIRGRGLDVVTAVAFGGVPSPFFTVDSPTRVTAVSPARDSDGDADVVVSTPQGSSKLTFTYFEPLATWTPTGSLSTPRGGHTATPLLNGKVLVAGGWGGLSTAELYDPRDGKWTSAESMSTGRVHHTATRLPNGQVLVVGGDTTGRTAEIYDPSTDGWSDAGTPVAGRIKHTATLLRSGQVLVTGGEDPNVNGLTLKTAEFYDPSTRNWSVTDSMSKERASHGATLLAGASCSGADQPSYCGNVLVAGGHTDTAELYDPRSGKWTSAKSMHHSRRGATATPLDDGTVLVAGGSHDQATAEVFNPAATDPGSRWSETAAAGEPRMDHTATKLPDGKVLVAGGDVDGTSRSAELYNPLSRTWSPTAEMDRPRSGHTATLLPNGEVLAAGGGGGETSAELYRQVRPPPLAPVVTKVDPPVGPSGQVTAVRITGRGLFPGNGREVTVMFGSVAATNITFNSDSTIDAHAPPQARGTVDVVVTTPVASSRPSPASNFTYAPGRWAPTSGLDSCGGSCSPRYLHTATVLPSGKVLVAGGTANFFITPEGNLPSAEASAQLYDPVARRWSAAASMKTARFHHTATVLPDGKVLVVGGQDERSLGVASAEIYDPLKDEWSSAGMLTVPRFSHTASLLPNGNVLVVGGASAEVRRDTPLTSAEIYDRSTKIPTWHPGPSLTTPRQNHTATVLPGGKVLVAGGLTGPTGAGGAKPTESVELFEPEGSGTWGAWRQAKPLAVARFDHSATTLSNGNVLVAGGAGGGPEPLPFSELYNPPAGTWSATGSLNISRSGHSATLLADGTVLVSGSGETFPRLQSLEAEHSAERYDPISGQWSLNEPMAAPRGGHRATVLPDGTVLATGGYRSFDPQPDGSIGVTLTDPAEIYTPGPTIRGVTPRFGPIEGGTSVILTGGGFAGATGVRFGDRDAIFHVESPTVIRTSSPPQDQLGPVTVTVEGPGGASATLDPDPAALFSYVPSPGEVRDLAATAVSGSEISLAFTAPPVGTGSDLATAYVVKQSPSPILDLTSFEAATTLCGGICRFPAAKRIELGVTGLSPATTYHYALRAVREDGVLGPISNSASATTSVDGVCLPIAEPAAGQVRYPPGYSLVGVPAGTLVGAASPLSSWFDQGAGGSYSVQEANQPTVGGRGYWAWFRCPRLVEVSGPGASSVTLPLGAYHASMVGNPSGTGPARVLGQDFAARWDSSLNRGSGGYHISGYRQPQNLSVGEGVWVFTYDGGHVVISAG